MWRALVLLMMIEQNGLAIPPLPIEHPWADAIEAAKPALAACKRDAEAKHLVGDVIVTLALEHRVWGATASASLGAAGPKIAACARSAIEKHFVVHVERYVDGFERDRANTHVLAIGDATTVLAPPATLLPAWRAAIAPGATKTERAAFAKLLPVDYKLDHDCLVATRPYLSDVEAKWVEHAGTLVSGLWRDAVAKLATTAPWMAVWDGRELVTEGRAMCLVAVDPPAEATLRAEIDRIGTCWAGSLVDILTRPRVEFPRDRSYTHVDVHDGRACAVTTTGDVTCCGAKYPALAAPPQHVAQVAIGTDFTCGLDTAGNPTCTGSISTAPRGPFRKLNASHDRVCGLHRDGTIECWGAGGVRPIVLAGTFVDVAADQQTCGVHGDGVLECTTSEGKRVTPPGTYRAVAMVFGATCALRRDGKVGCFEAFSLDRASSVATLSPDAWTDLAIADGNACGRRADRSIACVDAHPAMKPHHPALVPPPGPFAQLAGEGQLFCGVTAAGQIACWGRLWPGDSTPPVASRDAHGTIVDERGAPIAGAEVMICDEAGPCSWVASLARTDPGTLAALATKVKDPKGWTITTTAADGTWHVATPATSVGAVITAPGREVLDLDAHGREELVPPLVLRPASTIDLAAWCEGHACTTPKLGDGRRIWDGTHLEHVAPGTYHLVVWNDQGSKYEKVAAVDVEMPFAVRPQTARLVLRDTGTKHDLHGTVEIPGVTNLEGHHVSVRCTGALEETWRDAKTDRNGAFDVWNVGALPCRVDVAGASMELVHYTDPISLHGNLPRMPRR